MTKDQFIKKNVGNIYAPITRVPKYQYIKQMPQVAILPFLITSVVSFFIPELAYQIVVLIAISAIISIITARILYKKGRL